MKSDSYYCDDCEINIAEIFQYEGNFCLKCWQDRTHTSNYSKVKEEESSSINS